MSYRCFIIHQNIAIYNLLLIYQFYSDTRTVCSGSLYNTPSLVLVYQQSTSSGNKLLPVEGNHTQDPLRNIEVGKYVLFIKDEELTSPSCFCFNSRNSHLTFLQDKNMGCFGKSLVLHSDYYLLYILTFKNDSNIKPIPDAPVHGIESPTILKFIYGKCIVGIHIPDIFALFWEFCKDPWRTLNQPGFDLLYFIGVTWSVS